MLLKFESEGAAGFVMFADVAQQLLKMMGHRGGTEGAIKGADLDAAIHKLESGLRATPKEVVSDEEDEDAEAEPAVNMSARGAPLLELLRAAKANASYVMWRPE